MSKRKSVRSVGHDGLISIFIKRQVKRKFLWMDVNKWVFVLGKDRNPIVFNKQVDADMFIKGKLKYRK